MSTFVYIFKLFAPGKNSNIEEAIRRSEGKWKFCTIHNWGWNVTDKKKGSLLSPPFPFAMFSTPFRLCLQPYLQSWYPTYSPHGKGDLIGWWWGTISGSPEMQTTINLLLPLRHIPVPWVPSNPGLGRLGPIYHWPPDVRFCPHVDDKISFQNLLRKSFREQSFFSDREHTFRWTGGQNVQNRILCSCLFFKSKPTHVA